MSEPTELAAITEAKQEKDRARRELLEEVAEQERKRNTLPDSDKWYHWHDGVAFGIKTALQHIDTARGVQPAAKEESFEEEIVRRFPPAATELDAQKHPLIAAALDEFRAEIPRQAGAPAAEPDIRPEEDWSVLDHTAWGYSTPEG